MVSSVAKTVPSIFDRSSEGRSKKRKGRGLVIVSKSENREVKEFTLPVLGVCTRLPPLDWDIEGKICDVSC